MQTAQPSAKHLRGPPSVPIAVPSCPVSCLTNHQQQTSISRPRLSGTAVLCLGPRKRVEGSVRFTSCCPLSQSFSPSWFSCARRYSPWLFPSGLWMFTAGGEVQCRLLLAEAQVLGLLHLVKNILRAGVDRPSSSAWFDVGSSPAGHLLVGLRFVVYDYRSYLLTSFSLSFSTPFLISPLILSAIERENFSEQSPLDHKFPHPGSHLPFQARPPNLPLRSRYETY